MSGHFGSAISESGMVENAGLAVGILILSHAGVKMRVGLLTARRRPCWIYDFRFRPTVFTPDTSTIEKHDLEKGGGVAVGISFL